MCQPACGSIALKRTLDKTNTLYEPGERCAVRRGSSSAAGDLECSTAGKGAFPTMGHHLEDMDFGFTAEDAESAE